MKIVFPDGAACINQDSDLDPLRELGQVVVYEDLPTERSVLIERVHDADVIVLDYSRLTGDIIAECTRLKVICFLGIGYKDYIDVEEATRRGISVNITPAYGSTSVAEHTLALMLALARHIIRSYDSTRQGRWEPSNFKGTELKGKTLGIVGLGPIGLEVARLARAIGMQIIAWTRSPDDRGVSYGLEYVQLDELFRKADLVTLHLAHTGETEGIISRELLRSMKKDAFFINTSRAALVDNGALIELLRERKLGGAAVDVFETEPIPTDHPLLHLDNVVLTPHIGFNTREAGANQLNMAIDNLKAFLNGEKRNVVN
jgi:phosphoglycerate dehydrogenase-like enzyme